MKVTFFYHRKELWLKTTLIYEGHFFLPKEESKFEPKIYNIKHRLQTYPSVVIRIC